MANIVDGTAPSAGDAVGNWVQIGKDISPSPSGMYELTVSDTTFPTSVQLVVSVDGGATPLEAGSDVLVTSNAFRLVGPVSERVAFNVNLVGSATALSVDINPV